MTTPTGLRLDSVRIPRGLRTPRARARSTATYTATYNARILYLTGGEQRPVENLQQQPLATMRDEVTSCQ